MFIGTEYAALKRKITKIKYQLKKNKSLHAG